MQDMDKRVVYVTARIWHANVPAFLQHAAYALALNCTSSCCNHHHHVHLCKWHPPRPHTTYAFETAACRFWCTGFWYTHARMSSLRVPHPACPSLPDPTASPAAQATHGQQLNFCHCFNQLLPHSRHHACTAEELSLKPSSTAKPQPPSTAVGKAPFISG